MRKTKFRVWDKREQMMRSVINLFANGHVYVDCQCDDAASLKYHRDKNRFDLPHHPSGKDIELMQFTGLHDKNGKEIYEGDILRRYGVQDPIHVYWEAPCFVATGASGVGHWYFDTADAVEIIGNIYENPKLIARS